MSEEDTSGFGDINMLSLSTPVYPEKYRLKMKNIFANIQLASALIHVPFLFPSWDKFPIRYDSKFEVRLIKADRYQ